MITKERIIVPGPIVNLAAALQANAAVVFTIPVLAGQLIGVKSVKIVKVQLFNNTAGNTQVYIGTGVGIAFIALLPALDSFNLLMDSYGPETDLIEAEAFANITAWPATLVALGTIDIQISVAIIG